MKKPSFPRPLAGSYGAMLTIAILAISPFIVVTTAAELYREQIAADLGAGLEALSVISGLGTAGYAFGALLGGDFNQRFPQRRVFLASESAFVVGCLLIAVSPGIYVYGAGRVMIGLATGLLLVAALPPVIQRFPPGRMPITAAAVDIGFFGAVTAGPLIGGAVAYGDVWRWFYSGLAGIGIGVISVALFTLPDQKPFNPDLRFDKSAILLALAATALPFWAAGELRGRTFSSWFFMVPLAVGLACFVAMLLTQYHKLEPLSPVKPMWHTYPLVGVLAAMFGGGAYITFLLLTERYLISVLHMSPLKTGLAFWPQVVGTIVSAVLLGILLRTRLLLIFTLTGMLLLLAGGGILLDVVGGGSHAILLVATGLLGIGAGASVSPGLFMAGFSLPSKMVGRTFALVELVRSEADFIIAPVMLQVAQMSSLGQVLSHDGIKTAIWITILFTAGITLFGIVLYIAGAGFRLPRADLAGWLEHGGPALESPALGAAIRRPKRAPGEQPQGESPPDTR